MSYCSAPSGTDSHIIEKVKVVHSNHRSTAQCANECTHCSGTHCACHHLACRAEMTVEMSHRMAEIELGLIINIVPVPVATAQIAPATVDITHTSVPAGHIATGIQARSTMVRHVVTRRLGTMARHHVRPPHMPMATIPHTRLTHVVVSAGNIAQRHPTPASRPSVPHIVPAPLCKSASECQ